LLGAVLFSILLFNCGSAPNLRLEHQPARKISSLSQVKPSLWFLAYRYQGVVIETTMVVDRTLRLEGNPRRRPVWRAAPMGALIIKSNGVVILRDWIFRGATTDTMPLIRVEGGYLRLEHCDLSIGGRWAIEATPGSIVEIKDCFIEGFRLGGVKGDSLNLRAEDLEITHLQGPAIQLNSGSKLRLRTAAFHDLEGPALVVENAAGVWVDELGLQRVKTFGILLRRVERVRLVGLKLDEIGADGVVLTSVPISRLEQSRIQRTVGNGLLVSDGDSLLLMDVEFHRNGGAGVFCREVKGIEMSHIQFLDGQSHGLQVNQFGSFAGTNLRSENNAGDGFRFEKGDSVLIGRFSAILNGGLGLAIKRIAGADLIAAALKNNTGGGAYFTEGERARLFKGLIDSPMAVGGHVRQYGQVFIWRTVFTGDSTSLMVDTTQTAYLDSNRFLGGSYGLKSRSLRTISMKNNFFQGNRVAVELADFEKGESVEDTVYGADYGFLLKNGTFHLQSGILNNVKHIGLSLVQGNMSMEKMQFHTIPLAVKLRENKLVAVNNCNFTQLQLGIEGVDLKQLNLRHSRFQGGSRALRLSRADKVIIFGNRFYRLRGPVVSLSQTATVFFRHNILAGSGELFQFSQPGNFAFNNNTVAGNGLVFADALTTSVGVERNIFIKNQKLFRITPSRGLPLDFNCFWRNGQSGWWDTASNNFQADPRLSKEFFLQPDSPCLAYEPWIGALGPQDDSGTESWRGALPTEKEE